MVAIKKMSNELIRLKKIISRLVIEDLGKLRVPVSHSMGTSQAFTVHSDKESLGDTIDTSEIRDIDTSPVEISRIFKIKKLNK